MKTKLSILIAMLFIQVGIQASTTTFEASYATGVPTENRIIISSSSGGYFVIGKVNMWGKGGFTTVFRINENGDTSWCKNLDVIYTSKETASFAYETSDGGLLIAGSIDSVNGFGKLFLSKMSASGIVEWAKTYGSASSDESMNAAIKTMDNHIIMVGQSLNRTTSQSDMYAVKTDLDGNLIWSKTYGGITNDSASSIEADASGTNFYILGSSNSYTGGDYDMNLLKINSSGVLQWSKTYGYNSNEYGCSMKRLTNGNLLITGFTNIYMSDLSLFTVDPNGEIVGQTQNWSTNYSKVVVTSILPTTGGYIISGYGKTNMPAMGDNPQGFILKVSSSLTTLWFKNSWKTGYIFSSINTPDNGILFCGNQIWSQSGSTDAYLGKINQFGYINSTNWSNVQDSVFNYAISKTAQTTTEQTFGTVTSQVTSSSTFKFFMLANSNITSNKSVTTFGGQEYDDLTSLTQTDDGYAFIGTSSSFSFGGNTGGPGNMMGSSSIWITKTDKDMKKVWSNIIGAVNKSYTPTHIEKISNNGLLVSGNYYDTISNSNNILLVKLNTSGNIQWSKTYGGAKEDNSSTVIRNADTTAYLIAGQTNSIDTLSTSIYLIKTDTAGTIIWSKSFGKPNTYTTFGSVCALPTGGYLVCGVTTNDLGNTDALLIKLTENGDTVWTRMYGTSHEESNAKAIKTSTDNFYTLVCNTNTDNWEQNTLVMNINENGDLNSTLLYDFGAYETVNSIDTKDEYILIKLLADNHEYVMKINCYGYNYWTKKYNHKDYPLYLRSIICTNDGGMLIGGNMYDFGEGFADAVILKTNQTGDLMNCITSDFYPQQIWGFTATMQQTTTAVNSGGTATSNSAQVLSANTKLNTFNCSGAADIADTAIFQKLYGSTTKNEKIAKLKRTADGSIIMIGTSTAKVDNVDQVGTMVTKLKLDHTVEWSRTFKYNNSQPTEGIDIIQLTTGEYMCFSNIYSVGAFIIKLNEDGDTIVSKIYKDITLTSAILTNDNNFMTTGYTYLNGMNRDGFAMKLDNNADSIWAKTFGTPNDDVFASVAETKDNNYFFLGSTTLANWNQQTYLVKTNEQGDTSFTYTYKTDGYTNGLKIITANDGSLVTLSVLYTWPATTILMNIDKDWGTPMWFKMLKHTSASMNPTDLILTHDENYAIVGSGDFNQPSNFTKNGYLLKISKTGDIISSNTYGSTKEDQLFTVCSTPNDGFYLGGYTQSFGSGYTYAYLLKTDANGFTGQCYKNEDVNISINTQYLYEGFPSTQVLKLTPPMAKLAFIDKSKRLNLNIKNVSVETAIAATNVTCHGLATGAIDLTVNGGITPIQYTWSSGQTLQDLTGISKGTYKVTVSDNFGCTVKDSVTITEPNTLTLQTFKSNISCNGGANGTARVIATGGTLPYHYTWNTGQSDSLITKLFPGTFFINVFDKNNCLSQSFINITQPLALTVSHSKINNNCNGGNTGSINISVINGTVPYTYLWSNGATTEDISGLAAGTYTVTVTDSCGTALTDTATITQPKYMTAIKEKTDVLCYGNSNGTAEIYVSNGTAPYTYKWSYNNVTAYDITNLPIGTYTVTATDNCDLTITDTVHILQPNVLSSTINKINTSCYGGGNGTATAHVTGGTKPYTFTWNNAQSDSTAKSLYPGFYSINIVDAKGCLTTNSTTITQPNALQILIAGTNITCYNASTGVVNITVSGGTKPYSYVWSNSSTTKDLSNIKAGDYTVTVSDSCGNQQTASITITQPNAITTNLIPTNAKCKGNSNGSINLTAQGGTLPYTFKWSNTKTTEDLNSLQAGKYKVTVTDNCFISALDSVEVTQPEQLNVNITKTNIKCNGNSDGIAIAHASGGTQPFAFRWNNGITDSSATQLFPGNYSINVVDANGCIVSGLVNITQPLPLAVKLTSTNNTCYNGSSAGIDITVTNSTKPYTFAWSNNATTEDLTDIKAGVYTVTVSDSCGSSLINSVTITEPLPMSATIEKTDASCFGSNNGVSEIYITNGTAPYTYAWSHNNVTSHDITGLPVGKYFVTITDKCSLTLLDSITITQPTVLTSSISKTNVSCFGSGDGKATAHVTGGTKPYTFTWNNSQSDSTAIALFPGFYSINIVDAHGCLTTNNTTITQPTSVQVQIAGTNLTCYNGINGAINLTITGGTKPFTYQWSNSSTNKNLSNVIAGTYTVTVSDSCGNNQTASITLTQPDSITISMIASNVRCYGNLNGSINLTTQGGTLPYTFTWSNAKTTEDISGLALGQYKVTVSDACSITAFDSIEISQPNQLNVTIDKSNIVCNGGADGSAIAHATGGTQPYAFRWNNGLTDSSATQLFPGNYSINVVDANSCLASGLVNISQPLPLNVKIASTNNGCFGGTTASIDITVNNGTKPYVYKWSNDSITEDLIKITKGRYIISVTDACNQLVTDSATITEPDTLKASLSASNVSCFGSTDGKIAINVNGGSAPYTYIWSNNATAKQLSALSPGSYSVTISDKCNIKLIDSATIKEPIKLSLSKQTKQISCYGLGDGSIAIAVTGGVKPYRYNWNTSLNDSVLKGLFAGKYNVNIFDANNCLLSDETIITQPTKLNLTLSTLGASCSNADGNAASSVTGGTKPYTYKWSNGDSLFSISNIKNNFYTLTVTDKNKCIITDSVEVKIVVPIPEICMVTVDSDQYNAISWQKLKYLPVTYYRIYKQNLSTSKYDLIDSVIATDPSVYVDYKSKPWQQSDRYKISLVDSCGNESEQSLSHRTMHMTTNISGQTANLIWDNYEGIDYLSFDIYRGKSQIGLVKIGSVPNNGTQTFTDIIPKAMQKDSVKYQVTINLPYTCDPKNKATERGPYTMSRSNVEDAGIIDQTDTSGVGIEETALQANSIDVYPNSFSSETHLTYTIKQDCSVHAEICDILGKTINVLVNENQAKGIHTYSLNQSNGLISAGIYYLKISFNNSTTLKKLVKVN